MTSKTDERLIEAINEVGPQNLADDFIQQIITQAKDIIGSVTSEGCIQLEKPA